HLAGFHLLVERVPELFVGEEVVFRGMELVEIDVVRLQIGERAIELFDHVARRPARRAIEEPVVLVPELRRDHPVAALPPERAADERFRETVAVALGRVDEVDALFLRVREEAQGVVEGEGFSPLAAELPRAEFDDRDDELGLSEGAVFHRAGLPTWERGWYI